MFSLYIGRATIPSKIWIGGYDTDYIKAQFQNVSD